MFCFRTLDHDTGWWFSLLAWVAVIVSFTSRPSVWCWPLKPTLLLSLFIFTLGFMLLRRVDCPHRRNQHLWRASWVFLNNTPGPSRASWSVGVSVNTKSAEHHVPGTCQLHTGWDSQTQGGIPKPGGGSGGITIKFKPDYSQRCVVPTIGCSSPVPNCRTHLYSSYQDALIMVLIR
jgi:hypothetical protein